MCIVRQSSDRAASRLSSRTSRGVQSTCQLLGRNRRWPSCTARRGTLAVVLAGVRDRARLPTASREPRRTRSPVYHSRRRRPWASRRCACAWSWTCGAAPTTTTEFYCPGIEWDWGDGTESESSEDCEPYQAGVSTIKRRFIGRARLPAGGQLPRLLPAEAEATRSSPPASANVQVRAGVRDGLRRLSPTCSTVVRRRRDGGPAGPRARAAARRPAAPRRLARLRRSGSSSPTSSACCTPASDVGDLERAAPARAARRPRDLAPRDGAALSTRTAARRRRGVIIFVKRRLVLPVVRWLFEYNRDNFERQRRVNDVLFACVQELAIETARLRQEVSPRRTSEARLRRPALRRRHRRRLRGALPRRWPSGWRRGTTSPSSRAAPATTSPGPTRIPPAKPSRTACACVRFPGAATAPARAVRRPQRRSVRRPTAPRASAGVVRRERPRRARSARAPARRTAPTTTSCCSGRSATARSFFGLPLVADRAVLVPTAEEDRALDLDVLQDFFRAAGRVRLPDARGSGAGRGAGRRRRCSRPTIDRHGPRRRRPQAPDPRCSLRSLGVPDRLRAVSRPRGSQQGLPHAARVLSRSIAAAGPGQATRRSCWPGRPRCACPSIRASARWATCPTTCGTRCSAGASALVVPSPYESLSIVLLEAWNRGVPALVNAHCAVLQGPGAARQRRPVLPVAARVRARRWTTC